MNTVSASVQYGDFTGEAKADNSDHHDVSKFLESKGIPGMAVAVEFNSNDDEYFSLAIYTAEHASSFDDVEAEAKTNSGRLKVIRHDIEGATVADLLMLFKRFNVVLRYRYPSVSEMVYAPQ